MDAAAEERDVKLQRASADLLSEFETALPNYLWKSRNQRRGLLPGGKPDPHTWVKRKTTNHFINLVIHIPCILITEVLADLLNFR